MVKRPLARIPVQKPITIGAYTLSETGLTVDPRKRPSFDEHEGVGDFIKRAHRSSGWWLADWLRYGAERTDWQDRIDQVIDATGLSAKTVKNVRAIGAIEPSRRRDGVEFSTHDAVVALPPDEQSYWLEQAEEHGWSQRELRLNIRAAKRRRIIEGQAVLEGMFRVIYADPPWEYRSAAGAKDGAFATAHYHYPTMSIEAIAQLPVAAHALPNSVLLLWVPAPFLLQNPGPREVLEAWGFVYKSNVVWDKVLGNFGHYFRVHHEHLIIATRGSCLPDRPTPQPDSVQMIRRSDEHSAKPPEFRALIERLYDGPYLELFGREPVENWSVFGNDAKLWAQQAEAQAVAV